MPVAGDSDGTCVGLVLAGASVGNTVGDPELGDSVGFLEGAVVVGAAVTGEGVGY